MPSDFHDASMKKMFDFRRAIVDMLRGFMPPDLVEAYDFGSLEQLPAQYVDDNLRQSRGDAVWRVRFRRGKSEGWLYLLLVLEFQSTVDRNMALRVHAYIGQLYLKLLRGKKLPKDGKLPPVLPVVIYTGRPAWTAPREVEVAATGSILETYQPRQRFFLVDMHRMNVEDLPRQNALSLRVRFAQGDWSTVGAELEALAVDPETEAGLVDLFVQLLLREVTRGEDVAPEVEVRFRALAEAGDLKEMGSLFDTAVSQSRQQGLEKGLEQGLEQQRALLLRQTVRKFGAGTAASLEALLMGIDDVQRLGEIGDHLIDSASGDELLSQAAGSARRH